MTTPTERFGFRKANRACQETGTLSGFSGVKSGGPENQCGKEGVDTMICRSGMSTVSALPDQKSTPTTQS